MDIFNVGGPELVLLLFLAGVLLGPRRMALLGRELGRILHQIQLVTRSLTKELNREIDLLDREMRLSQPEHQSERNTSSATESALPELRSDQSNVVGSKVIAEGDQPISIDDSTRPDEMVDDTELPEAYRRFIEDFPDDALEELPHGSATHVHTD